MLLEKQLRKPQRPHQGPSKRTLKWLCCCSLSLVGVTAWIGSPARFDLDIDPPSANDGRDGLLWAEDSSVTVPISIPIEKVRSVLEEKAPKELRGVEHPEVEHVTRERLEWIVRRGGIEIQSTKSGLVFACQVSGEAHFTGKAGLGIASVRADASAEATVRIRLAPTVDRQWTVKPGLIVKELTVERSGGSLHVLGIKVKSLDVSGKLREEFDRNSGSWIDEANAKLSELMSSNLRREVEKAWSALGWHGQVSSIGTDEVAGVFLAIEPHAVVFQPIKYSDRDVKLAVQLKIKATTRIATSEPASPNLVALPQLEFSSALPKGFGLRLPVACSFETLNALIDAEIEGQRFVDPSNGVECIVKEAGVLGSGDRIVVRVTAASRFKRIRANGTFYLVGRIAFDSKRRQLSVTGLEFSVESENRLLNTADWLLHSRLTQEMEKSLVVNFDHDIKRAEDDARKLLVQVESQMPAPIRARLQLGQLNVEHVGVVKGHLFAVVTASGDAAVEVK